MKRRDFLARGALVAGTAGLAGCPERVLEAAKSQPPLLEDVYHQEEVDLPVPQKFDVAEAAVRRAEGTTLGDADELEAYLDGQGLTVESLEAVTEDGDRLLELAYADERFSDRGLLYSLGTVSGGYAALVAGDASEDGLRASIHESGGATFGEFEVETAAAERYLDGEDSAATYAGTVADTARSRT